MCSCLPSVLDGFTPLKHCSLRQAAQMQLFLAQDNVEGSETLRPPQAGTISPSSAFAPLLPPTYPTAPSPGCCKPHPHLQAGYYHFSQPEAVTLLKWALKSPKENSHQGNGPPNPLKASANLSHKQKHSLNCPVYLTYPLWCLIINNRKTLRTLGKINLQGITKLKWFQQRILLLQTCRNEEEVSL